jgi:hypothetical protein
MNAQLNSGLEDQPQVTATLRSEPGLQADIGIGAVGMTLGTKLPTRRRPPGSTGDRSWIG